MGQPRSRPEGSGQGRAAQAVSAIIAMLRLVVDGNIFSTAAGLTLSFARAAISKILSVRADNHHVSLAAFARTTLNLPSNPVSI